MLPKAFSCGEGIGIINHYKGIHNTVLYIYVYVV